MNSFHAGSRNLREQCRSNWNFMRTGKLPTRKLQVEGLSKPTNQSEVEELFSQYGRVEQCEMKLTSDKLETFITFYSAEDAEIALKDGKNSKLALHNRLLRVWAPINQPPTSKEEIETIKDDGGRKINMLNNDCLSTIFLYLPIQDRIRSERVCKRWQEVSQISWMDDKYLTLDSSIWGFLLQSVSGIDCEKLRKVLERCGTRLKEIHLPYIDAKFYSNALSDVAELCPNVQAINMYMSTISSDSLRLLGRNCHDIRRLTLGKIDDSGESALTKLFKQLTKLTDLAVAGNFEGECLLHLPRTIRELDLRSWDNFELDWLTRALPELRNLSVLRFRHPDCSSRGDFVGVMKALSRHCKQLKVLDVSYFDFTYSRCRMPITDLGNLARLKLNYFEVDDVFLFQLSRSYKNLIELEINSSQLTTFNGIRTLAALPKLEKLIINRQLDYNPAPNLWSKCKPSEFQKLPRISDFPCLRHLEYNRACFLSPIEICCFQESSPLLELVVLCDYGGYGEDIIEWLIGQTLARNSKVVFNVVEICYD